MEVGGGKEAVVGHVGRQLQLCPAVTVRLTTALD